LSHVDFDLHEGLILLSADDSRGLWAFQSSIRGSRPSRTAGSLPTSASRHTLLAVGLTAALQSITKKQAAGLVSTAKTSIVKPRLCIVSTDPTFADALQAKMKGHAGRPLRTGKNFLIELARNLARFQVTLDTEVENYGVAALRRWAAQTIADPKAYTPDAFAPTAASCLL
jgi:hypothetical protein